MTKYENKDICVKELASALNNSKLSLFIGAGISSDFGLPQWSLLIKELCTLCNVEITNLSNERLAALCFNALGKDAYKKSIKEILYKKFLPELIINYPLLVSIGAMCTGSNIRGRVREIVTYNYDNILEIYLSYYGIIPKVIKRFPYYSENSDIKIYHPHGYLPFKSNDDSDTVALDTNSLYQTKNDETFWPELSIILRHNVLLFIGLSFEDRNLEELIFQNKTKHPSINNEDALGFYFVRKKDIEIQSTDNPELIVQKKTNTQKMELLREKKIYPMYIENYADISLNLAIICQKAATLI